MYFEGPDHLSRFYILFVHCEDPNFVTPSGPENLQHFFLQLGVILVQST